MYIGSGDVSSLMSKKETKAYQTFFSRFCSGEIPYYNAKASPIDALRTGAILEERYFLILPENYFPQMKVVSKEMDVFKASLDFGKIEGGKISDFDELKTIWFEDFFKIEETESFVKTKYKKYFNQIQEQLYCSELLSCNIVFLAVYSYKDEINYTREITEKDIKRIRINRDEKTIEKIKEAGEIFQTIKNNFK